MKKGISLIVLVITIIIMIIIAGAIILSLNSSNVTGRAKLSTLSSDRASYKAQYAVAYANAMALLDTDGQDVTVNNAFKLAIGQGTVTSVKTGDALALNASDVMSGWTLVTTGTDANKIATKTVGDKIWTLTENGEVTVQVNDPSSFSLTSGDMGSTATYYWVSQKPQA